MFFLQLKKFGIEIRFSYGHIFFYGAKLPFLSVYSVGPLQQLEQLSLIVYFSFLCFIPILS